MIINSSYVSIGRTSRSTWHCACTQQKVTMKHCLYEIKPHCKWVTLNKRKFNSAFFLCFQMIRLFLNPSVDSSDLANLQPLWGLPGPENLRFSTSLQVTSKSSDAELILCKCSVIATGSKSRNRHHKVKNRQ